MSVISEAEWLRAQSSLTGTAPPFDPSSVPHDPLQLFSQWIRDAVQRGVSEPHAATLATVDADGIPDARTLILKDVSDAGWAFAGPRSSRKGDQLMAKPVAALNFWWQPVMRAVRVRGVVREATQAESDADLAARSPEAREGIESGEWVLWRIVPSRIEFWQGALDRRHIRVVYEPRGGTWTRSSSDGPSRGTT